MRKTIVKAVLMVFLVALLGAGIWLWNPQPNNPAPDVLSAAAARYDAEIIRDEWGVPHIFGETDADASFGLAYAHAEDDFETIQETVAATRGMLARYRGTNAAPTDYIVSLFGVWDTLDENYANGIPQDVKDIADAYAAGINLYAAENPDQTWAGLAPFTGKDVIAGFVFKTPFFYGLDKTLLALFEGDTDRELALAPMGDQTAWRIQKNTGAERGSNGFAVSANRSDDNRTRLVINSHQPMTGPVAWYEAHLVSKQGLDITGGLFPGTPIILHGFNRHLGWANTVNHIDLADVYQLTVNPDNAMQYRLDGAWHDFEVSEASIMVRLWGPFALPVKRKVLRGMHGPVIQRDGKSFALRYAGMGEYRQLEQYYKLNKADSFPSFMDAMAMNALPSINYVYADKDDNIGFIHNAQYPARNNAWDWQKDLPGDRSDLIWQGYRPYDAVPKLINPQSGFVFNSNNTPFSATDGPDNLRLENFPQSMGLAVNQTNRSMRVIELMNGTRPISRQRLLDLKFDDDYAAQSDPVRRVGIITAYNAAGDPMLADAIAHIAAWDRSTDIENRHAALVITTLRRHFRTTPNDDSPEALIAAVKWAANYLIENHGRIDPIWGDVSRLVRGNESLPVDGGPDTLRAIYATDMLPDGTAPATHGDTWIALVEWDADDNLQADVIHQFGSATLDEGSPHYADQARLFAKKQWRRALIERQDILASSKRHYRPGRNVVGPE